MGSFAQRGAEGAPGISTAIRHSRPQLAPFTTGLEGLPGAKSFPACEMHYSSSNPADARLKPTWKSVRIPLCLATMMKLYSSRILDHPKEKLDYNSILFTTAMHFGFTTSRSGNANSL